MDTVQLEERLNDLEQRIKKIEVALAWGLYDMERKFADEVEVLATMDKGDVN